MKAGGGKHEGLMAVRNVSSKKASTNEKREEGNCEKGHALSYYTAKGKKEGGNISLFQKRNQKNLSSVKHVFIGRANSTKGEGLA